MRRFAVVAAALLAASCASAPATTDREAAADLPPDVEALSLAGTPLTRTPLAPEVESQREKQLAEAREAYDKNPDDADAVIWLGRRTAYLGRYRESIEIFSEGIRKHPDDARLYRHRGHRFITVRQFDRAVADLQHGESLTRGKPDEVEPDGIPNARNTPVGSLQSNICYHLGLAWYLKGDFERALPVWRRCTSSATNPDRLVSSSHWLYMTLRRLGRAAEAEKVLEPIGTSMDVIESVAYHKLLLMYAGDIAPEELIKSDAATTDGATILYGIGNWYLHNGEPEKAREIFRRAVAGNQWAAFGFIAAEAELARQSPRGRSQ
jgi:tetratricopeptide (TPR) repeat protein